MERSSEMPRNNLQVEVWESAEQVVAGAGNEQTSAEEMSPKRERRSKAVSPPDEVASRRVKPEPVNGAVATTSVSGS
jgi:hypothetical protein